MKRLLLALALFSTPAIASPCDQFYPNGKEIVIPDTTVLCNTFFATVYNPKLNGAVFSTEVAQERLVKTPRTNDFHADKRLANAPTPDDYTNTGYDRGHMAAAANADDPKEMSETFLMSNMTPQLPYVNRVAWKGLEERTRSLPFKYIVTGAIYSATPKTIGTHKVPVPDALYKVVFFESGKTAVYILDNVDKAALRTMPLDELEKIVGYKIQ